MGEDKRRRERAREREGSREGETSEMWFSTRRLLLGGLLRWFSMDMKARKEGGGNNG